jgi:hypothetical protein
MLDTLSSISAGIGSFFSGVLQVATWLLAVQGLLLGLLVLFYGRRSFWVFASVFGFVLGLSLATNFGADLPGWAQPLLAIVLGGAGAWLAFRAPRPIAAIIGGALLALIAVALTADPGMAQWLRWVVVAAVGILGFYLVWRLLDWALIFATSLFGAGIAALSLSSLFGFTRVFGLLPFALLLAAGIVYQRRDQAQAAALKRARAKSKPAEPGAAPALAVDGAAEGPATALPAAALPAEVALAPAVVAAEESTAASPEGAAPAPATADEEPAPTLPAAALPADEEPPAEAPSAFSPVA